MRQMFRLFAVSLFATGIVSAAEKAGEDWQPVTGEQNLSALFTDTLQRTLLKGGVRAEASYNADGTGELRAWGEVFSRQWRIEGGNEACIRIDKVWECFGIERSSEDLNRYRGSKLSTGEQIVFTVSEQVADIEAPAAKSMQQASKGGPNKPSANEVAKSLANPNTPLASLTLKLQYRTFEGDLPDADSQDSTTLLFQPTFPFPLDNGDLIFFRPAIPILINQPFFTGAPDNFDEESGLGDIVFDLAYGRTNKKTGVLWAAGVVSTLPTATEDELGKDKWTLGPEFLIGKLSPTYVLGLFPSYQTDIGGSGDADVSLTTMQAFAISLPGGGWNWGTTPIITYDHEIEEWSIPLNLTVGKTVISKSGRPWKLSAEINYFVETPDEFGPEWFIGFSIAPVVENVAAGWFN